MNRNLFYADMNARAARRHVESFVMMVTEGEMSYTAAWEVIKSRTTFGPDALTTLWDDCLTAATEAKAI